MPLPAAMILGLIIVSSIVLFGISLREERETECKKIYTRHHPEYSKEEVEFLCRQRKY